MERRVALRAAATTADAVAAAATNAHLHADDVDELGQPLILFRGPGATALHHVVGVKAHPPVQHAGGSRLAGNFLGNARPLGPYKRKKKKVEEQTYTHHDIHFSTKKRELANVRRARKRVKEKMTA